MITTELDLIGKVAVAVTRNENSLFPYGNENIRFTLDNGDVYELTHTQDCCESVYIEDINGDLSWLVGHPILSAEITYSDGNQGESSTWSFCRFSTYAGTVVIRFFGESNGYYSETAELIKCEKES